MAPSEDSHTLLDGPPSADRQSCMERGGPSGRGQLLALCQSRRSWQVSCLAVFSLLVASSACLWRHQHPAALRGTDISTNGLPMVDAAISLVAESNASRAGTPAGSPRDEENGARVKLWDEVQVNSSGPLSLYCFSLMFARGIEEELLTFQWGRKLNIFQCDDWDVISNERRRIGGAGEKGFWTTLLPDGMHDKKGVVGVDCSETPGYLNAWTFMNVWALIIGQRNVWRHDFAVKVDADSVFFPSRLPAHVQQYRGQPIVLTDCWGNKLWGSLEVFSRAVLARYADDMDLRHRKPDEPACPEQCKKLTWWCWGEDEYMQRCMETIGASSVFDPNLVQQGCNAGTCSDPRVAFHKYGEVWRQEECLRLASR
mmetsp:Transcript_8896/g.26975  ORF Transcript_8896/g.26975 Transcript_8896/m.26975 type:complete len:370 (-) Transcript_8896:312-1421(-)